MCFWIITQQLTEIVGKDGGLNGTKSFTLVYLPGAWALTDPPQTFGDLIAQRRRWINGSNMIFLYIFRRFREFWKTDHHPIQKIGFTVNFAA